MLTLSHPPAITERALCLAEQVAAELLRCALFRVLVITRHQRPSDVKMKVWEDLEQRSHEPLSVVSWTGQNTSGLRLDPLARDPSLLVIPFGSPTLGRQFDMIFSDSQPVVGVESAWMLSKVVPLLTSVGRFRLVEE